MDELEQEQIRHPGGAPSKFEGVDLSLIRKYFEAGLTEGQVAMILGVARQTIYNWKKEYEELFDIIKAAKSEADDKVEHALYERATGYTHPDVHICQFEGHVIKTEIEKHYPPDTAAAFIWLKNRRPGEWKDKKEVKVDTPNGQDKPLDDAQLATIADALDTDNGNPKSDDSGNDSQTQD